MNKLTLIVLLLFGLGITSNSKKVIARQGQVSFFSYTSVENIKAENNQVLSIIDLEEGTIAVDMLMNAFVFEKALMREHFNESYIETDIYPKATFNGRIEGFDAQQQGTQVKIIKGAFTMRGVTKDIEIKTKIENNNGGYMLSGTFETFVKDYNINIPPLLAGNIAKSIEVNFKFEYQPYEN
ncbi:YceI family protein [Winogradskyella jejuensis]|uniref:YceI-like domain-containing protein n=1 Tax=Winogradskyella jejuensis TaxID=1089305 RepID=A0A1M5ME21_9FLAO|nr:YceI family protein [Winogradskyella jejuensis]SHG75412.1 YceI-like domain-containing protein [Winogradskyella jejuensis]